MGSGMSGADCDLESLPEREREVLRFLLRGYDAKSVAQALGLSVNVVNERLRDSRRRLGVSSSREAARRLAAHEGADFLGDKQFGIGSDAVSGADGGEPDRRARLPILGAVMMLIAAAALGIWTLNEGGSRASPRPDAPPRVVVTSPAGGAVIRPGPFLLTVTYDQPMIEGSFSYTRTSSDTYPDCAGKPELSRDGRIFTLRCTAMAGRRYEIWFNRPPYMNFRSLNGLSAEPHQLLFRVGPR
jgi:DNA-binding CsgD family transcriptional regulator